MSVFLSACFLLLVIIPRIFTGPSPSAANSFLKNIPRPSIGHAEFKILSPFVTEGGQRCSMDEGCLSITNQEYKESSDTLGVYSEISLHCKTTKGSTIHFSTRQYDEGIKVYKQLFVDGLKGTSVGDKDDVSSAFPVFDLPDSSEVPDLRFATPGGYMLGWTLFSHGSVEKDLNKFRHGESGGIVVFSQVNGLETSSIVMAGLSEAMSINVHLDEKNRQLLWGIQGLAQNISPGYAIETITREDNHSTVRNVLEWGKAELAYHQCTKMADLTSKYLSYWTDNGAAYYYNPDPYPSYTNLVLDIFDYSKKEKIPIKGMQLDSWWYHKGAGGGIKNWTEDVSAIPGGIRAIKETTNYLITAHNRYFSSDTDYAIQNGGKYPFVIDELSGKSLPLDISFWEDLMKEAKAWGLDTYEQDWLNIQYEDTGALHSNVTLGSSWLDDMGEAALRQNISIQYCMSLPRHYLHSAKLPAVTQIRVSDDYLLNQDQWQIGKTSLFAHALGLLPFKDLFWSTKENSGVIYSDCESLIQPDPNDPIAFLHSYKGYLNKTAKGVPCLEWSSIGYDALYPNGDVRSNLCRNPGNMKDGSFCFTEASADIPVDQWKWGYCKPLVCEHDCYTFQGANYVGNHIKTRAGASCVSWNGKFGLTGANCRNPSNETKPWCYIDSTHSIKESCNVPKCPEHTEFNPTLQSAVATLSTGPVGIGDKIENLNNRLIMKSCSAQGLILKPSIPLMVTNVFFTKNIDRIWSAQSIIGKNHYGIIFTAENSLEYKFSAVELNLEAVMSKKFVFYENYPTSLKLLRVLEDNSKIVLPTCGGYMQFCLYYLSPLIKVGEQEVAVLGELTKWTPVSPNRIIGMEILQNDFKLYIFGSVDEFVEMQFYSISKGTFSVNCSFASDSAMTLSLHSMQCSASS